MPGKQVPRGHAPEKQVLILSPVLLIPQHDYEAMAESRGGCHPGRGAWFGSQVSRTGPVSRCLVTSLLLLLLLF